MGPIVTPLMMAAKDGRCDLIAELTKSGADVVDECMKHKMTALETTQQIWRYICVASIVSILAEKAIK